MAGYLSYLLAAILLAILAVLLFGVVTMGRRDAAGNRRSNRLMRWRVGLQFAALAVILLIFLLQA